jgi:hypothetical protein
MLWLRHGALRVPAFSGLRDEAEPAQCGDAVVEAKAKEVGTAVNIVLAHRAWADGSWGQLP